MGIDHQVLGAFGGGEHVFEDTASQAVQTGQRQVQDAPRGYVRGFGLHHLPDVKELQLPPLGLGHPLQFFQERFLVDPDLSGYYYFHYLHKITIQH